VDQIVQSFEVWIGSTYISHVMREVHWSWPISESIHFVGLCLLIRTVGLFDLRMMDW
jgi:hypothetical protein